MFDLASITTNLLDHVLVLHGFVAYLVVGLLCFGEAAFMLGFVIPGETAVVIGGVLAARGRVSLPVMVVVVVICAIVGDSVGYEVGRVLGPRIIGRFTAFLRAMVPGLAGMSGMHYPRFFVANAAGGIVWGTTFTLLGYFIGQSIEKVTGPVSLVILGVIVVVLVGLHVRTRVRKRRLDAAGPARADEEGDQSP